MDSLNQPQTLKILYFIAMLIITVASLFGLARYLDKITLPNVQQNATWSNTVLAKILENPDATAWYYGLRWLGLCLVGHGFLSRFI